MNGPPERLPAGTGISSVSPDPQVLIQTVAAPETPEPKQKYRAYKNEKDIHRHALDYYFLLGKERRLEKVAEKFKVSLNAVQQWSASFDWKERVRWLEERGFAAEFDETMYEVLALAAHEMITIDTETGKKVLNKKEFSPEKAKTLIQAKAYLREDRRKGDPDPSEPGAGPDSSTNGIAKAKGGMMVNVIITK